MARPSHPPRLDYSNYTWRRVQIMKLLVMPLEYCILWIFMIVSHVDFDAVNNEIYRFELRIVSIPFVYDIR
jgi:hypothetical protein